MKDEKILISVGKRIRQKRIENGFSQIEFAKRIGYKTKGAVSLIETGRRDVNTLTYVKIANTLDVSVDYLLGLE